MNLKNGSEGRKKSSKEIDSGWLFGLINEKNSFKDAKPSATLGTSDASMDSQFHSSENCQQGWKSMRQKVCFASKDRRQRRNWKSRKIQSGIKQLLAQNWSLMWAQIELNYYNDKSPPLKTCSWDSFLLVSKFFEVATMELWKTQLLHQYRF